MIGMFAVSEIIRNIGSIDEPWEMAQTKIGNVFRGMWTLTKRYPVQTLRGSVLGTAIGALPGAGADIAAWMSYAMSKRFSKEPEKFGTGHIEGIIEAGASNNSALAGAWIPALVFGIPGDSITAIVIGVLYIKGLNPGPTIFMNNAPQIYAIFLVFILANLLMLPLGVAAIKGAKQMLRAPREVLMPVILLFCVVGSFAINNSIFGVVLMLGFGLVAYVMEENGFPVAPAILGMVLGAMLEENFISSMTKAAGRGASQDAERVDIAAHELPVVGALLLRHPFHRARLLRPRRRRREQQAEEHARFFARLAPIARAEGCAGRRNQHKTDCMGFDPGSSRGKAVICPRS